MEVDLAGAGFEVAIVSLGGVVSIKGTPKYRWMVYNGKAEKKMDGNWGVPLFLGKPHISLYHDDGEKTGPSIVLWSM